MDYKNISLKVSLIAFFFGVFLFPIRSQAQSKAQRISIQKSYSQESMMAMSARFEREHKSKTPRINQLIAAKGLQKTERFADGTVLSLKDIGTDGTPLFYTTLMDPTSKVSRANALYKGGILDLDLTGEGLEVGVWDAGTVLDTHQEFDTRAVKADDADVSSHATMVTGTIISSGVRQKAKGVAFAAKAKAYDWTRDKIEVVDAAANGLLLSNHSYGIKSDRVPDWYFGSYIKVSQDWDEIMYSAPYYLMVTAAGNAQNAYDNDSPIYGKTADGFDLLLGFTTSKNGITVAGADTKITDDGKLKDAKVASYSSFGPTDDGRIKPDLAGDGTSVFSASASNNQSYSSSTGTSMATPGVTGSLLLLQQYHEQLYGSYMRAATLKGLALHTADDVQAEGPDYKMGWGVLNSKRAAEVLKEKEYSAMIAEESLAQGATYSITVNAKGNEPLMASISWTDPKGEFINRGSMNDGTAALTNDLDIRITKTGQTYLPWKLNPARANDKATKGDNKVDPYERIDIKNAKGEYTITVSHKSGITNGVQNFSLIVTGIEMTPCKVETPKGLHLASATDAVANFEWNTAEETLFEIQYKEVNEDQWITGHTWNNTWKLPDLNKGSTYSVRLRAVCTENMVSEFSQPIEFTFNGTATAEEEQYESLSIPNELQISLYPNPAVNQITVDGETSKDAVYSIVTTSGNVIKKGALKGVINVSDLSSGLYVMMVQDYSGIKSSKFYKN